jgi:hypothetical protein
METEGLHLGGWESLFKSRKNQQEQIKNTRLLFFFVCIRARSGLDGFDAITLGSVQKYVLTQLPLPTANF